MLAHSRWVTIESLLIGLLAIALLVSGCSGTEGLSPFTGSPRRESEGRPIGQGGKALREYPAPVGEYSLSLMVSAGLSGDPTRTDIVPDSEGADVLWEPGDMIAVQYLKDGVLYHAAFVTSEGGSSEALFRTNSDILGGSDYIFFSPGYSKFIEHGTTGARAFGLNLPAEQLAMAGGVNSEAAMAFAYSESFQNGMLLTFSNLPAMIRFRLEGGVASQVRKVTLRSTSAVAGDALFREKDGSPEFHPGIITGDEHSSTITLTGEFEAGAEYHIALWPREIFWLEMEFSDDAGNHTTLRSGSGLTLEQSVVTDIGTINLGDSFRGDGDISLDPIKYMTATEGTKPVSIVVVPDGFTLPELPMYESRAKMALDYLFEAEPYKTYKNRFNAWILKVASNESGAGVTDGNGNVITPVDNYFGTKWGTESYGDMQAVHNTVLNFVSSNCPDIKQGIHNRNEVPIIILVNDNRYGGRAIFSSAGWSYCMVPMMWAGAGCIWRFPKTMPNSNVNSSAGYHDTTEEEWAELGHHVGDWRSIVTHEFGGHSFGRLSDEYWVGSAAATSSNIKTINDRQNKWTVPYGLNISTSYTTTPWDTFLQKRDELIERDQRYSRIGVFQGGAGGYLFGVWRSEMVSCLQDNRQYFNAWSRYLIVKRIMTLSGDLSQFNLNYFLERDVTADPARDDPDTRSGDPDRSGRYYYIFPHDTDDYLIPDAPPLFIEDEDYMYVRPESILQAPDRDNIHAIIPSTREVSDLSRPN